MRNASLVYLVLFTNTVAAYTGDYFELRRGLPNSPLVFEQSGKGRVVFLGGSITHMKGWREMVCTELERRFPRTQFDFVDAGIPSTGSTPGAYRLARDVFRHGQVDLLFEEAAVNDSTNGRTSEQQVRGMEGIVRHARELNPNIDIVLMHFVDPGKMRAYNDGQTPEVIGNHEKVAAHYGVPSINFALEVTERINRGEFTWEDDFKDLHPSPFGHRLYANTIARLFDAAWSESIADGDAVVAHHQPDRLDRFCYDAGILAPPGKATHLDGFQQDPSWTNTVGAGTRPGFVNVPMLIGEAPRDGFELSFTGSAVGLFVAAGPDAGIIKYQIDGSVWKQQDLYTQWSSGLHIPWLYLLEDELASEIQHRLVVQISSDKNPSSRGHACRVVHFAVNVGQ